MSDAQTFAELTLVAIIALVVLTKGGDGGQTPPGPALLRAIIQLVKQTRK